MAFTALSSNDVGSGGAASVSITGIPSSYSALRLVFEFQPEFTGALDNLELQIRFNGLTTSNASSNAWSTIFNECNGYQASSVPTNYKQARTISSATGYGCLAHMWGTNYTGSYKNNGYVDIYEYANTNNNTIVNSYYQVALNGSGYYAAVGLIGNCFDTAASISSIQLQMNSGDIAIGSTFDLYGVE